MQLADLTKLQVHAYFDEPEIGDLKLNNPVTIVWDAKPDMKFHGHIIRLPSSVIDYGTRRVGEVLISIEDSDGFSYPTSVSWSQSLRRKCAMPSPFLARLSTSRVDAIMCTWSEVTRCIASRWKVGALNLTLVQIVSGLKEHTLVALGTTNGAPMSEGVPIRIVD